MMNLLLIFIRTDNFDKIHRNQFQSNEQHAGYDIETGNRNAKDIDIVIDLH